MTVREHLRPVAIKNEQIGVAAIGESRIRIASERLADRGPPGFRTLPRVEVPVELFGSEWRIAVREVNGRVAKVCRQPACGGNIKVSVVAVGLEPRRKIPREGQLLT